MTFDVTRPASPALISWTSRRDHTRAAPGPDSGAEVIHFVPRGESPANTPLVLVANEVSGTVTPYPGGLTQVRREGPSRPSRPPSA